MSKELYDALIIGGGPAGLCAAINGASEGLRVAILESNDVLGGQAKESAAIENYPLPFSAYKGVSGDDLLSGFAAQAAKFGTKIYPMTTAARLSLAGDGREKIVTSTDFETFRAKSVLLTMGLSYRRMEAKGIGRMMGRGVFYGMPSTVRSLSGRNVAIVGGANSAGQAAVRLARTAQRVSVIVRGKIETPNIEVFEGASVQEFVGEKALQQAVVDVAGDKITIDLSYCFIYIGGVPYTAWLMDTLVLDEKKFILTDSDLPLRDDGKPRFPNETSIGGVFAAGDVRAGQSVKRITGAVGDGISSLTSCHRYCAENWNH